MTSPRRKRIKQQKWEQRHPEKARAQRMKWWDELWGDLYREWTPLMYKVKEGCLAKAKEEA
jgi:hypothetical protein